MLKIHFMNPEILKSKQWKMGTEDLTLLAIFNLLNTWNVNAKNYPRFSTINELLDEADIRVVFDCKCKLVVKGNCKSILNCMV